MPAQKAPELPREAVGIFHEAAALDAARDELLGAGFDRADLSLLASERAVEEKLGHRYERTSALADDPAAPRAAYVSTERGGLLLWVQASTPAEERLAVEILRKHSADCIHLHGIPEPSAVP